jgi:tRNA U34 5-methylaminomethyl-2-thiouridine-forming methyltransferase MnmC
LALPPIPPISPPLAPLKPRTTGDGSFSLFCLATGEGFHCAEGAKAEAQRVFVTPAGLERFAPGSPLRVVEVAVGTGTNTAALLEATQARGLDLHWWGLERDPRPLALALDNVTFQGQWSASALAALRQLAASERVLWGDARRRLDDLPPDLKGGCDLVLLDAFSPQRCPQLWSVDVLTRLARLLRPEGRLLTYCCAAAVRRGLEQAGLQLATIPAAPGERAFGERWSGGTAASPSPLPAGELLALSPMEREHLASRAGEPYRDPTGQGQREEILALRQAAQACSSAEPASQWRRRWGMKGRR